MLRPVVKLSCALVCMAVAVPLTRGMAAEAVETALSAASDAPARLLLAHWPERGWTVRQSGRQVELALPGAQLAVDLSAVALPLGGDAIRSLSVETGAEATYLQFGLGCDCTIAVHGDGRRLAIDVVGADLAAGPLLAESGPAPRRAPPPPRRPRDATAAAPEGDPKIEATRDRLLGELRRAAESGLVDLQPAAGPGAEPQPGGAPELSVQHASAAAPEQPVRAETYTSTRPVAAGVPEAPPAPLAPAAGDPLPAAAAEPKPTATVASHEALVTAAPAPECLGSEALQLPDPLPPENLVREIARLRQSLTGEFDRPDPEAVAGLARLYIAHGLGTEALGLLAELGTGAPGRDVLAALAWLVEERPLPELNILAVPKCGGQHALWQALDAALAGRNGGALQFDRAAAGALEQMARGLRGRAAAHIGLAAAAEEDRITAHRLLAMATRSVAEYDRAGGELVSLLNAEDARLHGDTLAELAALEQLQIARSTAGGRALIMLAERLDAAPDAAPARIDRLRLDLGALALAGRGTPAGAAAFLMEVRLTARSLGRDFAFDLLEYGRNQSVIAEGPYLAALSTLAAKPEDATDTGLALIYEADPGRFAASLDDRGFRRALARSYAGFGAPSLADSVLRGGDLDQDPLAAEIAQAFLADREHGAALDLASMLPEGPERSAITAWAAHVAGDPAEALRALQAAQAPPMQRAAAAWAARDWEAALAALGEAAAPISSESHNPHAPSPVAPEPAPVPLFRHAALMAYVALQAGHAELPPQARALLREDPAMLSGVEAMFPAGNPGDPAGLTPAEVPGFLDRLGAEARILEALLDDG